MMICSVCWVLFSQCLTSCTSQHGSQSGDDCLEQQHKGKLWKNNSFKSNTPWDIDGHRHSQVALDHIFTQVSTGKHFSKLFCINGHRHTNSSVKVYKNCCSSICVQCSYEVSSI